MLYIIITIIINYYELAPHLPGEDECMHACSQTCCTCRNLSSAEKIVHVIELKTKKILHVLGRDPGPRCEGCG